MNKGHIFFIDNFNRDFPPEIEKLIEYEIYERLRVFVGLIGIPEKKKELKVTQSMIVNIKDFIPRSALASKRLPSIQSSNSTSELKVLSTRKIFRFR